ncbi:MAG: ATP-binding protein [Desulfobacterales bacterium]|nr:ATP-binding protein [Desulfobacterales bacterium]
MIISVASGKGGTGKTTVAVNLALSINSNVALLDCDVEEPNGHIFIKAAYDKTETVFTPVPEVDEKKCNLCGKCGDICRFKAIVMAGDSVMTFPELCHSCGGCKEICPEKAITEVGRELGFIQRGLKNNIEFIYGKLRVGEAMSPPLIRKVRSFSHNNKIIIIDAPPGTSCPVIASLKGSDFVVLVTEPTPFGLHDLKLAVSAVRYLNISHGLVINRSDIGDNKVVEYAKKEKIPILMEIPFDRKIAEIYSRGETIVENLPEWKEKFYKLYENIEALIKSEAA